MMNSSVPLILCLFMLMSCSGSQEAESSWIQARFQAKLEEIRILRLSGLLMKRIRR
jgi:hypothetical protein